MRAFGVSAVAACVIVSVFGVAGVASAAPLPLRVVTWNVWDLPVIADHVDERIERIGPALAELEPDLVALQEVWDLEHARTIGADLAVAGLVHQTPPDEDTGLLVASRFPITDTRFTPFTLGQTPWAPWHVDWIATKGVVSVELDTPAGRLVFADTHLQGRYRTDRYPTTRIAQALEVTEATAPAARDGDVPPLVLAGDLNSPSHELPFEVLVAAGALRPTAPTSDLDAILVRDGTRLAIQVVHTADVLASAVDLGGGVAAPLSDHPAVMSELVLTACPSCGPVWTPGAGWPVISRRAHAHLETRLATAERDGGRAALGAVVVLLLALGAAWRLGWRRRLRAGTVGLAGLVVGGWLLYLGLAYVPVHTDGLLDARARIEATSSESHPHVARTAAINQVDTPPVAPLAHPRGHVLAAPCLGHASAHEHPQECTIEATFGINLIDRRRTARRAP